MIATARALPRDIGEVSSPPRLALGHEGDVIYLKMQRLDRQCATTETDCRNTPMDCSWQRQTMLPFAGLLTHARERLIRRALSSNVSASRCTLIAPDSMINRLCGVWKTQTRPIFEAKAAENAFSPLGHSDVLLLFFLRRRLGTFAGGRRARSSDSLCAREGPDRLRETVSGRRARLRVLGPSGLAGKTACPPLHHWLQTLAWPSNAVTPVPFAQSYTAPSPRTRKLDHCVCDRLSIDLVVLAAACASPAGCIATRDYALA